MSSDANLPNLHGMTLDAALLWLRTNVYDADRKAIAALLVTRPDLARSTLIADYIWAHVGDDLIKPLEGGAVVNSIDAMILEHLPPAQHALRRIVEDSPPEAAMQAGQILAGLTSRLLNPGKEQPMSNDDLDDLFGPTENADEDAEEPTERGTVRRPLKLQSIDTVSRSHVIEVAGNSASILAIEDNDSPRLQINATLMNLINTSMEITELQFVLRGENGDLLDVAPHYVNTRFQRAQEVVAEIHLGAGVLPRIRRIEINAQCNFEFRSRLATATLRSNLTPAQGTREIWIEQLQPAEAAPGFPQFEIVGQGYLGSRYEMFGEFVLQITDLTPSVDLSREIVVALRDSNNKVMERQNHWTTLCPGTPTTLKVQIYGENTALQRAASADIAAKGFVRRSELIAAFSVLNADG